MANIFSVHASLKGMRVRCPCMRTPWWPSPPPVRLSQAHGELPAVPHPQSSSASLTGSSPRASPLGCPLLRRSLEGVGRRVLRRDCQHGTCSQRRMQTIGAMGCLAWLAWRPWPPAGQLARSARQPRAQLLPLDSALTRRPLAAHNG